MMKHTYCSFSFLIRTKPNHGKWVVVTAIDSDAAKADLRGAYGDNVEIITWQQNQW